MLPLSMASEYYTGATEFTKNYTINIKFKLKHHIYAEAVAVQA
jgi:hypothetical protein